MSNLKIKLNLAALKHVVRKEKRKDGSEVECLIIPIDQNYLYRGDKGMYLDLTAIESKEGPKAGYKDTHFIKQSLPKEVYDKMTDDQRKSTPIMGNLFPWDNTSSEAAVVNQNEDDDLPF